LQSFEADFAAIITRGLPVAFAAFIWAVTDDMTCAGESAFRIANFGSFAILR
jgi:hypothetical protein